MCGIFSVFEKPDVGAFRKEALKISKLIRHRGPDYTGTYMNDAENVIICHERLAIVDPDSGDQPLYGRDKTIVLGVNGEIYNHMEIRAQLIAKGHKFKTGSDCEIFVHLYAEYGDKFMEAVDINGMFAFVLYDSKKKAWFAARDSVGIIPLYYGFGPEGSMWIASEMKTLVHHCPTIYNFPPGKVYSSATGEMTQFFTPAFKRPHEIPTRHIELGQLRDEFIKAVKTHLMSDVPYGVLLSGGLDSSLVASIMARFCEKRVEEGFAQAAHWPRLHSFTIGLEESPDLVAAQKCADFLGTVHHAYNFTVQEGLDCLDEVIYHLETFDTTTIRASTPMYLMSRKIKATGVKMVLSGEGADEVFGGYLYFHKCPSRKEFHEESCRKVNQLHYYDCLRANKSMMAWGVEGRVPFLDRSFLEYCMSIDPAQKMCGAPPILPEKKIEKHILRAAFDVRQNGEGPDAKPWLPDEILWRQKEQFSDGVGYSWIDGLKDHANTVITDRMLKNAKHRFPISTPGTKEAYLGRQIFEKHFPGSKSSSTVLWQSSIACSTATALKWDKSFQNREDDSGRSVIGVHDHAHDETWSKQEAGTRAGEKRPGGGDQPNGKRQKR